MGSKSIFLDVDSSICEKNYLIAKDTNEEQVSKLFGDGSSLHLPPKLVKPMPGFCIKTKEVNTNSKVFINVCQTDAIPAPKDISEEELLRLLDLEDDVADFRIPMSIGDIHNEPDKKGEECKVCDIAINTEFFEKIIRERSFKQFFIAVAFEGLHEKYGIITNEEKVILKHKKCLGNLQMHRIQRREIDEKMGIKSDDKLPSIDEVLNKNPVTKPKIEIISDYNKITPEYRLFQDSKEAGVIHAEVYLPYIISPTEINVDIGEDRILVETTTKPYFLDIFHHYLVDQYRSTCTFDRVSKFLTITMPVKGG